MKNELNNKSRKHVSGSIKKLSHLFSKSKNKQEAIIIDRIIPAPNNYTNKSENFRQEKVPVKLISELNFKVLFS